MHPTIKTNGERKESPEIWNFRLIPCCVCNKTNNFIEVDSLSSLYSWYYTIYGLINNFFLSVVFTFYVTNVTVLLLSLEIELLTGVGNNL